MGFGFGDCVIMELLRQKEKVPTLQPQIDFVIVAYNADMRHGQVKIAASLRQSGFAVDVLLEPAKKLHKAFSYADRVKGRRVLLVAPDEWSKGLVRMKDLRTAEGEGETSKEVDLQVEGLVDQLKGMGIVPMELPKV